MRRGPTTIRTRVAAWVLPAALIGASLVAVAPAAPVQADPVPPPATLSRICPGGVGPAAFPDTVGSVHAPASSCAAAYGLLQGRGLEGFAPRGELTRGQAATALVRLLALAGVATTPPSTPRFADTAASVHGDAAERLAALGIVGGRTADRFAPDEPVQRGQLATMLHGVLRTVAAELPATSTPPRGFVDVPDDHLHVEAITDLAARGVLTGDAEGRAEPGAVVTRGQAAALLLRLGDLLVAAGALDPLGVDRGPVLAPELVVVDPAGLATATVVTADGVLELAPLPEGVVPGALLVLPAVPTAPAGLLAEVVAVDGEQVRTRPAPLTAAVQAGSAAAAQPVTAADLAAAELADGVTLAATGDGGVRLALRDVVALADGVVVRGHVELDLISALELEVRPRDPGAELARVDLTTRGEVALDLALRAERSAALTAPVVLLETELPPLVAELGALPVTVARQLTITLEGDGRVREGTRVGVRQRAGTTLAATVTPLTGWTAGTTWVPRTSRAGTIELDPDHRLDAGLAVRITVRSQVLGAAPVDAELQVRAAAEVDPDRERPWRVTLTATGRDLVPAATWLPDRPGIDIARAGRTRTLARAAPPPPPPPPPPIRVADGWVRAPGTGPVVGTGGRLVRYTVEIADGLASRQDLDAFTAFVDAHLGDPRRGWTARGGFRLQRVPDASQAQIRVLLARPATVDRLCGQVGLRTGGIYSCWNGRYAALNSDRWFGGVRHVDDLTLYRGYLVNHEVGHGLGFGHRSCPGPGRIAPVMMQLSKSTYGCRPNAWPYP